MCLPDAARPRRRGQGGAEARGEEEGREEAAGGPWARVLRVHRGEQVQQVTGGAGGPGGATRAHPTETRPL